MRDWVKQYIREVRGNALWDIAKFLFFTFIVGFGLRLIEHYRNVPSDILIDAIIALVIVLLGYLFVLKKQSGSVVASVKRKLILVVVVVSIILALLIGWWASIPGVYRPFVEAYDDNKDRLGKPLARARQKNFVYGAAHENAIVIWFDVPRIFYILNLRNSQWQEWPDPEVGGEEYEDERWLKQHFPQPEGTDLGPPYSGVAKHWANWDWIGGRRWHCDYVNTAVYIQRFEHGLIMGGFPANPRYGDIEVFMLFDEDHKWSVQKIAGLIPPVCQDPVQRRRP